MNPGAIPGNQIVATARPRQASPTIREKASPFDQSLDNVAQGLAPLSVLVSIWMVIPALTSLGIGLRLVRRTRSQLTAEP